MHGGKDNINGSPSHDSGDLKGDILIRDLCMQGTDSIHDICVMNIDTTSYQSKYPDKCLETANKAKKKKYIESCL